METIDSIDKMNEETNDKKLHVQEININQILANRYQPRTVFEELELLELANSITQHGLLQPIILRKVTSDMYEIVAGERRYRASKLAGLETVSAIVKEITAPQAAILALIENVQREDLSAIEEAKSYEQLAELFDKTQNEIADMVGKSQSAVANKLRLLQLTDEVKLAIDKKLISERHGRALLKVKDPVVQNNILALVLEKGFTVATLEEYIERFISVSEESSKPQATIFNVAKDTKLAVNTINKAVKTIQDFGMDINIDKSEEEDAYVFNIVIPKIMVETERKSPRFAHEAKTYETPKLEEKKEPEKVVSEKVEEPVKQEQEATQPVILDYDLTAANVFDFSTVDKDWGTDEISKIIHSKDEE